MTVAERGPDLLRALLPRYQRAADTLAGGALDALLAVLGDSVDELREEVAAGYDNLFVETCAPALIPLHAAHAGVTELTDDRAWVGLLTGLRRRKGTLDALVAAACAATGFRVSGAVGAEVVATTWSATHALPAAIDRPFARVSGFPLPGVIELSVWRLSEQPVCGRTAGAVPGRPRERTFHPFGVDQPLFENAPFAVRAGGRDVTRDAVVDPARGRMLLPAAAADVVVDYSYGSAGDIGGGPYPRVERHDLPHAGTDLAAGLRQRGSRVVRLADSATYLPDGDAWRITVPAGERLRIAATPGTAPAVAGDVAVRLGAGATLELAGLLLGGTVTVSGPGQLAVGHCTLRPRGEPSIVATGRAPVTISVHDSILGPVAATAPLRLGIRDSIVDGPLRLPSVALDRVTVLGPTDADVLVAEHCLFAGRPTRRAGVLRQCAEVDRGVFTSTRYGDPAYGQLAERAPRALRAGDDGAELGAFAKVSATRRLDRLAGPLAEFVPAGTTLTVRLRS